MGKINLTERVYVRLTKEEKKRVEQEAAKQGYKTSQYIRSLLLKEGIVHAKS